MNRQRMNGRVRGQMDRPAHEWMFARMNGYIIMPPVRPLYLYHQHNTNRPWVGQRKKNEATAGPFFFKNRALEMRGPQQRNAKMGKRETTAWAAKTNRLGGAKGESGAAITGM